jgi:hypothetical protein
MNLKEHHELIKQSINDGLSDREIVKILNDKGIKITTNYLREYCKDNDLTVCKAVTPIVEPAKETKEKTTKSFDFKSVTFEQHFDYSDTNQVIEFMQKSLTHLVVRQLEIVAYEQEQYYLGKTEELPVTNIRKLQILTEQLYKIAPLDIIANQQKAIETVQRMGYTITADGLPVASLSEVEDV